MSLIPGAVLAQVRKTAETGLATTVTVKRRTVTTRGTSLVSDDYGDDETSYTTTAESSRTLRGWLHSQPAVLASEDAGALVSVTTYRLFLPVGSDIKTGDEVVVGDDTYVVSDTTTESTWQALLTCNMRKRE